MSMQDQVARITLDRPEKLNSFTSEMRSELLQALEAVSADREIRCLVVRGNGKAFSAGQDLGEREPVTRGEDIDLGAELEGGFNRIVSLISELPMPVICAVHGAAAGAGANLALACDVVVVTPSARFIQSFARIGLVPDSGGTWLLPHLAGRARAMGLALLAEPLDGATAAEWGLVWRCVPDEELEGEVERLSAELRGRSPKALAAIKRAIRSSGGNTMDAQLALEAEMQREMGRTSEYRSAVASFLNGRNRRS